MRDFLIDVYSHHIRVSRFNKEGHDALKDYCKTLGQLGLVNINQGKPGAKWTRPIYVNKIVRVFATRTANLEEYRFHRNCLSGLLARIKTFGYTDVNFEIVHHVPPDGLKVEFTLNPNLTAFDYQIPVIEYLSTDQPIKIVTLQTGKGKTACGLIAIRNLGVRTLICIRGGFVEKWVDDVEEGLCLPKNEFMVIRGGKDLRYAIALAQAGKLNTVKVIIITNKTLQMYIKEYETYSGTINSYGGCMPQDLLPLLGIGLRLVDECHMDFHMNFKIDMYTHVKTTIDLSATLESDDPFINRMYEIKFPKEMRFQGAIYDKYIAVNAMFYCIYSKQYLRFLRRGRDSYSHVDFEQSLMRESKILVKYLDMIQSIVNRRFMEIREPGQKMLVFAATIEMCNKIMQRLRTSFPEIKIGRYCEKDPYEDLLTNDLTVSTVLSAGTGVDIPGLLVVLMTTAIGSRQANAQALGRLRRLKNWPDRTPMFYYLVCQDIPQHLKYHSLKVESFRDKVLSHNIIYLKGGI